MAQALWQAHVERALLSARKLKAGWPTPRLSLRDPMALRALVFILVVATFFAAGGERFKRVAAAFDWHGVVAPANFRIDAWVTPPVYTGRPPVMLPGLRPGETAQNTPAAPVAVPVRQSAGDPRDRQSAFRYCPQRRHRRCAGRSTRAFAGRNRRAPASDQGRWLGRGAWRSRQRSRVEFHGDSRPRADDRPDQGSGASGAWCACGSTIAMEDDYGVVEAKATFRAKEETTSDKPPRPLFSAPDYALVLPQAAHPRRHRADDA